ncbi:MAG: hypothetical protein A2669_01450 [Candidatus Yanofskybacteria bacterium RIFCSPHIGHO2_01_FULL_48_25b]|uniref:Uncharacterized protein n=1 Tax=Candidatus Yanofskybacteria bacterium RIFCSPHIGHO2_01_FULL_48_25b TaxID=1802672 RepID=A0A1F8EZY0_9BACT|nr:MAG: hypothetical protein A2669_01450 [Candidatus Yanofskybacteria bacterium RIFCSPHIGHO2_01_FULL_48_25b]
MPPPLRSSPTESSTVRRHRLPVRLLPELPPPGHQPQPPALPPRLHALRGLQHGHEHEAQQPVRPGEPPALPEPLLALPPVRPRVPQARHPLGGRVAARLPVRRHRLPVLRVPQVPPERRDDEDDEQVASLPYQYPLGKVNAMYHPYPGWYIRYPVFLWAPPTVRVSLVPDAINWLDTCQPV